MLRELLLSSFIFSLQSSFVQGRLVRQPLCSERDSALIESAIAEIIRANIFRSASANEFVPCYQLVSRKHENRRIFAFRRAVDSRLENFYIAATVSLPEQVHFRSFGYSLPEQVHLRSFGGYVWSSDTIQVTTDVVDAKIQNDAEAYFETLWAFEESWKFCSDPDFISMATRIPVVERFQLLAYWELEVEAKPKSAYVIYVGERDSYQAKISKVSVQSDGSQTLEKNEELADDVFEAFHKVALTVSSFRKVDFTQPIKHNKIKNTAPWIPYNAALQITREETLGSMRFQIIRISDRYPASTIAVHKIDEEILFVSHPAALENTEQVVTQYQKMYPELGTYQYRRHGVAYFEWKFLKNCISTANESSIRKAINTTSRIMWVSISSIEKDYGIVRIDVKGRCTTVTLCITFCYVGKPKTKFSVLLDIVYSEENYTACGIVTLASRRFNRQAKLDGKIAELNRLSKLTWNYDYRKIPALGFKPGDKGKLSKLRSKLISEQARKTGIVVCWVKVDLNSPEYEKHLILVHFTDCHKQPKIMFVAFTNWNQTLVVRWVGKLHMYDSQLADPYYPAVAEAENYSTTGRFAFQEEFDFVTPSLPEDLHFLTIRLPTMSGTPLELHIHRSGSVFQYVTCLNSVEGSPVYEFGMSSTTSLELLLAQLQDKFWNPLLYTKLYTGKQVERFYGDQWIHLGISPTAEFKYVALVYRYSNPVTSYGLAIFEETVGKRDHNLLHFVTTDGFATPIGSTIFVNKGKKDWQDEAGWALRYLETLTSFPNHNSREELMAGQDVQAVFQNAPWSVTDTVISMRIIESFTRDEDKVAAQIRSLFRDGKTYYFFVGLNVELSYVSGLHTCSDTVKRQMHSYISSRLAFQETVFEHGIGWYDTNGSFVRDIFEQLFVNIDVKLKNRKWTRNQDKESVSLGILSSTVKPAGTHSTLYCFTVPVIDEKNSNLYVSGVVDTISYYEDFHHQLKIVSVELGSENLLVSEAKRELSDFVGLLHSE